MQREQGYPIKVVARRSGLTPHVIRVWEKRYQAVTPTRTPTNRRLYTEADIERLQLLRRVTEAGYSIGQVAHLPTKKLSALMASDETAAVPKTKRLQPGTNGDSPESHLRACLTAVQKLDTSTLEANLRRAAVSLSRPALIDHLISPLMQQIGDQWREGSLRVAHEHLASAVVRSFLGNLESHPQISESAPNIIITTPAGQLHEFGALLAATTAASEGWQVTYLGPNLPAGEIAGAAKQNHSKAVALSIIYPVDDPGLGSELEKLRDYLSEDIVLLVGGRGADGYAKILEKIGATRLPDIATFRHTLESLRLRPHSTSS